MFLVSFGGEHLGGAGFAGDFPTLVFLFGEGLLCLGCFNDDGAITIGVAVKGVSIIRGLGLISERINLNDDTLTVEGKVMTGWCC